MNIMKYYDYIKSEAWQSKRKKFYSSKMHKQLKHDNEDKWICYCCFRVDVPLDLHHRSYKRLGQENIGIDLVPVCRECHNEIHQLLKSKDKKKFNLWTATKKIRKGKQKKREYDKNQTKKKTEKC